MQCKKGEEGGSRDALATREPVMARSAGMGSTLPVRREGEVYAPITRLMRHALNGKRAVPQDPKTLNGALLAIINVKRGPDPPELTTTSRHQSRTRMCVRPHRQPHPYPQ